MDSVPESKVKVKGAAILPRFHYLEQHAPKALAPIVSRLPEPFRQQVLQGIFPDVWYPLEHFAALNRSIDAELGDGDGGLYVELGRHSADLILRTIYGGFYERGNPGYLFSRAQSIWDQYYSSGRVDAEMKGNLGVVFAIRDFADPRRSVCQTVRGWMERSIELGGGIDVRVKELSCAARGDEACVFHGVWAFEDSKTASDADGHSVD